MSERYPDDAALLALTQDAATGVEYIATGQSPYYVQFRRLMQRLLLAAQRANDFRVFQDGDLTVGVRGGRCVVSNASVNFAGSSGVALANNTTTSLWINTAGAVTTGTSGFPADRTAYLPLAQVVTSAGAITSIADIRGEALLAIPSLSLLGVTATPAEANQALHGIAAAVTAAALGTLTAGPLSAADAQHRHVQMYSSSNAETEYRLINDSSGASANVALRFDLPNRLANVTSLLPDPSLGWLTQKSGATSYALVGTVHAQYRNEGSLAASQSGKLVGIVPADGVVSGVILSVGTNIDSTTTTDGLSATAKVKGVTLTTTDPKITKAAGSGFRSTAQGHGTAAVVKSDGTQNVLKGDVLTVDVTRTAAGTIATEAANVVVMVVVRAGKPE
jgi:hypothetical protein